MAEENEAGTGQQPNSEAGGQPPQEPEFPTNTPVAEMTDKQAAAYWKSQSRKHEGRAKAFGDLTSEGLAELREKAGRQDALEEEMASDKDKAVNAATKTASESADAKYRPLLAETAFRVAIGDRKKDDEITDFLADLNLDRFVDESGRVDTAKVLARVEQFAPAKGNQQQQKGPTVTGHGSGTSGGSSTALTGREMYEQQKQRRTTSTV